MRRLVAALVIVCSVATGRPAAAWDPYEDWLFADFPYEPEPVYSWEPDPVYWREPEPIWWEPEPIWWQPVWDPWSPTISEPAIAAPPPPVATITPAPPPPYEPALPAPVLADPAPVHYAPAEPEPSPYAPPAPVLPDPAPAYYAPQPAPPPYEPPQGDWLVAPGPAAWYEPPPPPRPAIPAGFYLVTDVYAGDVVVRDGLRTTYSTTTVHAATDTYARVLEYVGTGVPSVYDGRSFNGRAQISDGRLVAGTYYENGVLTSSGFQIVSIVFFQDDSELARLAAAPPVSPSPLPVPSPMPSPTAVPSPVATLPPRPSVAPLIGGQIVSAPAGLPVGPTPAPVGAPGATPAPAREPDVRVGIALSPQGDALGGIELLRGRAVRLWPVARIDGVPARVIAWRLVSGELTALGPVAAGGDQPLVARWDRLAGPGAWWPIRMSVDVDVTGHPPRTLEALIEVVVRSPALVE